MQPISVFLGANSYSGFSSLYDQLLSARFDDLLILKGGPGCGKSTFMRTLAHDLAGEQQVHIPCSGDPDSLDAVLFPHIRIGVVDGTAPHRSAPIVFLCSTFLYGKTAQNGQSYANIKKHNERVRAGRQMPSQSS